MRVKKTILSIFFAVISVLGIYSLFIEPNNIEVHHIRQNDTCIGKTLKGVTAVHISDLHISKIGKKEKKVLDIIKDINPDVIFLTGDYIKWDGDYEPALNFLSELHARVDVWA